MVFISKMKIHKSFVLIAYSCCLLLPKISLAVNMANEALSNEQQAQLLTEQKVNIEKNKQIFAEKHYRQALYFYFQGENELALQQINLSKVRLATAGNKENSKATLFSAGLALSLGLQQQATNTLLGFYENIKVNNTVISNTVPTSTKQDELLVLALLQLAQQHLSQGENYKAQGALKKIARVTITNYAQYHILSQLAYWPNEPSLLPISSAISLANNNLDNTSSDGITYSASPYVQLNTALQQIGRGKFDLAKELLEALKTKQWAIEEQSFWQTLFSFDDESNQDESNKQQQQQEQLQHQAINDYAKLLLAQLYVAQGLYQKAYVELETFPQESPYADTAMFLFAFSAQKIKQYTVSFTILKRIYKNKPYSDLAWQSAGLMALQVSEQNTLEQAMSVYENIEVFYLVRLAELSQFEQNSLAQNSLTQNNIEGLQSSENKWFIKAMENNALKALYVDINSLNQSQSQLTVMQEKVNNIGSIIRLNNKRKQRVINAQQENDYQQMLTILAKERDELAYVLQQTEAQQNGAKFANKQEREWLHRIATSEQHLHAIAKSKNILAYQARLARIKSVLSWQLAMRYPQRLWSHKVQLKQAEQAFSQLSYQYEKVKKITQMQEDSSGLTARHLAGKNRLDRLIQEATQVKATLMDKTEQNLRAFVKQQRTLLNQHLLSSRQHMARILEQMTIKDKKIESQLNPDGLISTIEFSEGMNKGLSEGANADIAEELSGAPL